MPFFQWVWANDIDQNKAEVYKANHAKRIFHLGPVQEVSGTNLPKVTLSWASFPCQDISLAGNLGGLASARSGLVWQWLRVVDQMTQKPP